MMVLNFEETSEFQRDVKKLKKSWRSIPADIERAKLVLRPLYEPIGYVNRDELREAFFATKRATILHQSEGVEVVKMRLDCASLGSDKKTRIVFVLVKTVNTIVLVELFAKNHKERENPHRYNDYL